MEDIDNQPNKVILLGDTGVGKTCLIKVATDKGFDPEKSNTLTASFVRKKFLLNDQEYTFNIWDTIGQEKYRSLTKLYFKNAIIVFLVYDITSKKSFEALDFWYDQIKKELEENSYILALVGNKKDLFDNEEISEEDGKEYANQINAKFKLTSAKDDPLSFTTLLEELFTKYIQNTENKGTINIKKKSKSISLKHNDKKDKKKRKCC
jgi:small GTP-binding protein